MKLLGLVVIGLPVMVTVAFVIMAQLAKNGSPPGMQNGKLTPCPSAPHCVTSETGASDSQFVEPLVLAAASGDEMQAIMTRAIETAGGRVVSDEPGYLAAEFTSRIFGFIDDLECRIDPADGRVYVRSASRSGYSDLGVNRARVDLLREIVAQEL